MCVHVLYVYPVAAKANWNFKLISGQLDLGNFWLLNWISAEKYTLKSERGEILFAVGMVTSRLAFSAGD